MREAAIPHQFCIGTYRNKERDDGEGKKLTTSGFSLDSQRLSRSPSPEGFAVKGLALREVMSGFVETKNLS